MKTGQLTRRSFLRRSGTALVGFTVLPASWFGPNATAAPSNRVRVVGVGVGGRGGSDIRAVAREGAEIVGLCEVDKKRGVNLYKAFPKAKVFEDYRVMFDRLEREFDAVVVGTPDHSHAVITIDAMERGKHVYCEKPLTRTINEVRRVMEVARRTKVVTQLGNQGHSFRDIRRLCEWVWAGAIGTVKEVHVGSAAFPGLYSQIRNLDKINKHYDVPEHLNWDLWIGPVQYRPYTPFYHPFNWRGWLPFGTGRLGDWFCHVVDPAYWALGLTSPVTVRAEVVGYDPKKHGLTAPPGAKITYEFATKQGGRMRVIWYDGKIQIPHLPGIPKDVKIPKTGGILVGTKGFIIHGSHGAGGCFIVPDELMDQYSGKNAPPQRIPRVKNHAWDWLDAIRNGRRAGSDFATYGGPLTQAALIGVVAFRFPGVTLQWDEKAGRFTNLPEANTYLDPHYRAGWHL